jgi:hypothetical protein
MGMQSVLVWNGKSDAMYREARRQITLHNNSAPKTIKDIDFSTFFQENPNVLVYFPVFQNTIGWWGEMLGTNAKIQSKIIVSPECQLYEIGIASLGLPHQLYAAEIHPKTSLLQKMRELAITVKDMIATENGTVLTLLSGNNEDKIRNCIVRNGGEFFGNLGGY